MKEAIKLAIEKGEYSFPDLENNIVVVSNARAFGKATAHKMQLAFIAQDPLFWQALGKALGWSEETMVRYLHIKKVENTEAYYSTDESHILSQEWLYRSHQYFDLLMTGGDTEKFWKELCNA